MASVPTAERPPEGLSAYWLGVWRHALKTLKDQGSWAWEQRPLLDEYVFALIEAERARVGFAWFDHLEEHVAEEALDFQMLSRIATGLPTQWDRHTKRAAGLADLLALTPRGRKAINLARTDEDEPEDAFGRLDAGDELGERRKARTG